MHSVEGHFSRLEGHIVNRVAIVLLLCPWKERNNPPSVILEVIIDKNCFCFFGVNFAAV